MTSFFGVRARLLTVLAVICLAASWTSIATAQQLSIADAAVTEGNSGTKLLTFTVTSSAASTTAIRFDVATSNGSAAAGSDYVAFSSTGVRIPIGNSSRTVSIVVNGDAVPESDETFFLTLSNPVGATVSDGQATGTITNDDSESVPALSLQDVQMVEGNTGTKQATVTVSLSRPGTADVTFNLATTDDGATANVDYEALSLANQKIPAGQTSASFTVSILGDPVPEAAEGFLVQASNVVGATVQKGNAKVTIVNDDLPTLSINDASMLENGGQTQLAFRVELSQPVSWPVTFDARTVDGTATAGSDYTMKAWPAMVIEPGAGAKVFTVIVANDDTWEPDEYFTVDVSNLNGAAMPVSKGVGTILNDDPTPGPALSIAGTSEPEGGPGEHLAYFTVSLSEPTDTLVTFDVDAFGGTANGADYTPVFFHAGSIPAGETSFTFGVPITGDDFYEPDETILLKLKYVSGHAHVTDDQAFITLLNDDAPGLTVDDLSIPEGNAGSSIATFTVQLPGPAASPVTFDIATVDGNASAGSDYVALSLTGQTIPAGQSSKSFPITILGDTVPEYYESFEVKVSNVSGAVVSKASALGVIDADDGPMLPNVSLQDVWVSEGDAGVRYANFNVIVNGSAPAGVQYDISTSDGTALAGSDYIAKSMVAQTIPAGQSSAVFSVQLNPDTTIEADETFHVTLSNVSGAPVARGKATGRILNDDPATAPAIRIMDRSITEGDSGTTVLNFGVILTQAMASDTSFRVSVAGMTATLGSDVDGNDATFVIPAGWAATNVAIPVRGDTTYEPNETFSVTLVDVSGNVEVSDGEAVGIILDDDFEYRPELSVGNASVVEGDGGSKVLRFPLTLSAASLVPACFTLDVVAGTATAGLDYVDGGGSLCIPVGEPSLDFDLEVLGDTTVESDEYLLLQVSDVTGATAADYTAVGTIADNDAAPLPTISIADASTVEGTPDNTTMNFVVTLSAPSPTAVLFDLATAGGTATMDVDFQSLAVSSYSFSPGQTAVNVAVTVNSDDLLEPDETFTVGLSNVAGATVADGSALGTILNDDTGAGLPSLSIADVSTTEGNASSKNLTFTVKLSAPATAAVTYNIATADWTALAGSDYTAKSLSGQSIPVGASSRTFTVSIRGDAIAEQDEAFIVNVGSIVGATAGDNQATGTITNDDGGGGATPTLTIADVSTAEGNSVSKQMTFTVKLSAAAAGPVTYNIATANGTALSPGDYTAKSLAGQSIAAGATSRTFTVAIKGDAVAEANETFNVNVTGVTGATLGDGQATGTITNDDLARVGIARFDAGDLVDDVDDGDREPLVSTHEYASLLADSASSMCRRAPNATVIAVEGVEHKQVLADLASAANAVCNGRQRYEAVMADKDSRGFLIALPAKGEAGITASGQPEASARAGSTTLSIVVPGQAQPLTVVLADGKSKDLATQLRQRSKSRPTEALVLLGANDVDGFIDLTARTLTRPGAPLPRERILVNPALLERYRQPGIELAPLPLNEAPAQVLELQ